MLLEDIFLHCEGENSIEVYIFLKSAGKHQTITFLTKMESLMENLLTLKIFVVNEIFH